MNPERTNVYKGEFSPTGIETAFCYRKFYFSKILGLESNRIPYAMWFGSSIHKAVETYYVGKATLSLEEARARAIEAFTKEWLSYGVEGDEKRNLATGLMIMGNYCNYYKDDTADIVPEFVEVMQWIIMPNGTHLLSKIDRVRRDGSRLTVVDTKTSSWPLTDYYFQGYENNLQTSLYYHVVKEVLGECHQIQIDGIKVPPPAEKSATVPFARRTFLRTDLQLEDALNTYCSMSDYILSSLSSAGEDMEKLMSLMYCNQTKCNDFGGCEYLPICKYGLNHPAVQVDFTKKEVVK